MGTQNLNASTKKKNFNYELYILTINRYGSCFFIFIKIILRNSIIMRNLM